MTEATHLRDQLVGRGPELSRSVSALTSALASRHPVMIAFWAPSGTGKTRLVNGISALMPETDLCLVEAVSVPGTSPYSSYARSWFGYDPADKEASAERFSDLFDGLLTHVEAVGECAGDLRREFIRTRPWLEELASIEGKVSSSGSGRSLRSSNLADAIAAFFGVLSLVNPIIIAFENMHWFSSVDLSHSQMLIDSSQGRPISFLATSRPLDDGSEPEFPSSSSLYDRYVLRLDGIPRGSLAEFVSGFTGHKPSAELERLLWERVGGSPLLLEHTLEYLVETSALICLEGVLELTGDAPVLPPTIGELLAARIALLPAVFRKLISAAAVFVRGVSIETLSCVAEDAAVSELIVEAVKQHILTRNDEDCTIAFAHAALRQSALSMIPGSELEALHIRAAGALITAGSITAGELEEIGNHFLLGAELPEAVDYLSRSAKVYGDSFENEAAIEVRKRLAPLLDEPAKSENVLEMVKVQSNSGLMNESVDILIRTLDEIADNPVIDTQLSAKLMMRLGMCLGSTGKLKEAAGFLGEALAEFSDLDDKLCMSMTLRHMGMVELSSGETAPAVGHLEESVRLARLTDLPAEICSSLYWSAIAYRQTGSLDLMRTCTEEQVAIAEENALPQSRISGYDNLMRLHIYTTDYESAEKVHSLLVDVADRCGNWAALSAAASKMGIIHLRREEWEEAVQCFNRCVTLTGRTGNLRARCAALGNLAHASLGMEDPDSALKYSTQLIDTSAVIGFRSGLMSGYARMAYIFNLKGAWEPAMDCLETQIELAEAMGDSRNLSDGYATKARILLCLDDPDEGLDMIGKAIELSEATGTSKLHASQYELRGRLLYLLDRYEDAIPDLERALEMTKGKKGREKVAFASLIHLEASRSRTGDAEASARLLKMLDDAPDESMRTDLFYAHWCLTGDSHSAAGARAGLQDLLKKREQPYARRILVSLDDTHIL